MEGPAVVRQECKGLNGRLLTYLKRPDTVQKLLDYMVGQPSGPAAASGAKEGTQDEAAGGEKAAAASVQQSKHAITACEACPRLLCQKER